jgi:hypothetical protein
MNRPATVLAAGLFGLGAAAGADPPAGIALSGHVEHELRLTIADLRALPQTGIDVSFQTGHGPESGHFTGALVWDVVQKAGITDTAGPKSRHHLQHAVLVSGRDGYTVALSVGELDPDFEGKQAILTVDGADGARLIVPGDKKGGRDVRDVVAIEVD